MINNFKQLLSTLWFIIVIEVIIIEFKMLNLFLDWRHNYDHNSNFIY